MATSSADASNLEASRVDTLNRLAAQLHSENRFDEALRTVELGLTLFPQNYALLGNRAAVCLGLKRYSDSLDCTLAQLAKRQDDWRVWINAGTALFCLGKLADAEICVRQAMALGECDGTVRSTLADLLLLQGNLKDGLALYESRFESREYRQPQRTFQQPAWDGKCLDGKRILVWAEQGSGDMIQFVRYVPLLQARGAHVILEATSMLTNLFQHALNGVEIVSPQTAATYDVHCSILSLAHLCGCIPEPVPAKLPAEVTRRWANRLQESSSAADRKIGLVWAGSPTHPRDHERSLPLSGVKPLFDIPGLSWWSLQVGGRERDLVNEQVPIVDLAPFCTDFIETAGALAQMDLVITVDTSVAHLSGTQGAPTWTLLPRIPDWRWMMDRSDSPWYPSMRLFRQESDGSWAEVINRVATALR